jgi:predicted outer membrane repeat protein
MIRFRRCKAASFRPCIQTLEARNLLSTYTVDRLTDLGQGSRLAGDLRYCITNAADGDDIQFGVTGTINLTGALPDLTHSISIEGPEADMLTVRRGDAFGVYRILTVGASATVRLAGLTVADGLGDVVGGGILNRGVLAIDSSTIRGNDVLADVGSGCGIANFGMLSVTHSTIRDNVGVCIGGGIANDGTLTVADSTFSGNRGSDGGGIANDGTLTITNSTLSGNTAFVEGGGIYSQGEALHTRNTILAGNTAPVGPDLVGSLTSSGYNLIGKSEGGSGFDKTDLLDVDPRLGPLQDNGGPTPTMALMPGSPALNAGAPDQLGVPDQRGVVRSGGVNIGAYQASASAFVLTAPAKVTADVPFDLTVTARDPLGQPAVGYIGTVTFSTSDQDPGVVLPADYTFTATDAGVHTFTKTGRGETTLVTRGYQSIAVTDRGDGSITGSATVKVRHRRHHDGGSPGLAAGQDLAAADRVFAALRGEDFVPWLASPRQRYGDTGPWD